MAAILDRKDVIQHQLKATRAFDYQVANGTKIKLIPARYVPSVITSERISLTGQWQCLYYPFEMDEKTFAGVDVDDTNWQTVNQPGKVFYNNPEENPADVKHWNRVTLEHIDDNDGAILRKKVKIPSDWSNKRVLLRFNAVYPAGRFYCNGIFLGEHLSGLTPVEFDVTDIVKSGEENSVAVRLLRKHKYVQMDMPRHSLEFAGISQEAFFHSVEKVYINDYHLITSLDEKCEKGNIAGSITIRNLTNKQVDCKLTLTVRSVNNKNQSVSIERSVTIDENAQANIDIAVEMNNPLLWSDEHPELYDVEITLKADELPLQTVSYKTGFRRFELKNQRPLLNGRFVKFRGVNHLTYHPEFGMHTPKDWLRENLLLMKKANVNAIRTHFMGPEELLELCDEMGFYLLQELSIDWGHDYLHEPESVGPALLRLEGAVRRDRHHPSVMVWSVGNENMPRNMQEYDDFMNHLQLFGEFVRTLDPTRPTMFPPPGPANKIEGILETQLGDIGDIHYSFKLIREFNETGKFSNPMTWEGNTETFTREELLQAGWSGVWFSSEYGLMDLRPDLINAPYVSVISDIQEDAVSGKNTQQVFYERLRREWGYMREDPSCLGGAYFPWMCSGAGNNPWGWVRWGEDANWGLVTANLLPKAQFWALRVLFSPVWFPDKIQWNGEKEITFSISNQYHSIDLSECTLRTMMGAGTWMTMTREWKDIDVECPAGKTREITIPIWHKKTLEALHKGIVALCRCVLIAPDGFSPITADILIIPAEGRQDSEHLPIGPDAEL